MTPFAFSHSNLFVSIEGYINNLQTSTSAKCTFFALICALLRCWDRRFEALSPAVRPHLSTIEAVEQPPPARLLGLDVGRRRIGLALYDPAEGRVSGLDTLQRKKFADDIASLTRIAKERKALAFVAGLPLNMNLSAGPQARLVREFCNRLAAASGLPVHYQDERLTSVEAESRLKDAGWSLKKMLTEKRKGAVDRLAAVLILEDFVAAGGRA
jgi:putative Holliday junction resolvase